MKSITIKLVSVILCFCAVISLCIIPASADAVSDLREEIAKLEKEIADNKNTIASLNKDKADQQTILAAEERQLALLQSQIDLCNNKIRESNAKIAKNEEEILIKKEKMEATILEFKKRIRAIYMSGGMGTGLEILMGADNFDDFIALSQLTKNISRRDRKIVNDIVAAMAKINEQILENEALIASQKEIKATLDKKHEEHEKQANKVQAEIKKINSTTSALNQQNKNNLNDIEAKEAELNEILNPSAGYGGPFDGTFIWPVPSHLSTTSLYGERWGSFHKGIDIATRTIKGKPVVASASGVVVKTYTACPHNYGGKNGSCTYTYNGKKYRCGGGYGNHVVIAHGKAGSTYYQTLSAHLGSVAVKVGQYVRQGETIGYVGSTGWSTGWHLHFEVHTSSKENGPFNHQNPSYYVKATK